MMMVEWKSEARSEVKCFVAVLKPYFPRANSQARFHHANHASHQREENHGAEAGRIPIGNTRLPQIKSNAPPTYPTNFPVPSDGHDKSLSTTT